MGDIIDGRNWVPETLEGIDTTFHLELAWARNENLQCRNLRMGFCLLVRDACWVELVFLLICTSPFFFNHFTFCSFVSFSFCFFLLILQRTVTKPAYVLRTHTVHVNHAQSFPSEWATKFQQAKHSSLNLQILWGGITLQSDPFYKLRVLGAKPHRPIYISFRESFTLWCPELSMINLSLKSLRDFRKGFQRRRHTKWG